jgi:hypothetical protein
MSTARITGLVIENVRGLRVEPGLDIQLQLPEYRITQQTAVSRSFLSIQPRVFSSTASKPFVFSEGVPKKPYPHYSYERGLKLTISRPAPGRLFDLDSGRAAGRRIADAKEHRLVKGKRWP